MLVVIVSSCSTQEIDYQANEPVDEVFYATFEQSSSDEDTRLYADEDLYLRWTADDRVSIFNRITYNQQYKFQGKTGDNAGEYAKVENAEFVTGNAITNVVSVYPYQESTAISEKEVISISLPSEQAYAENTFGLGANTMVSVSGDNVLQYKNVGGYLMLKLYGDDIAVSSITLKGNNGEKISGSATVTMPLNGAPSVVMAEDASTEITLKSDSPIQLGTSADESTIFWFVVPPTTFNKGFTITVNTEQGFQFKKSTSGLLEIKRNTLSRTSALKVYDTFEVYSDLSGGGETANCYIINKAGEYKFPIIKGNGSKGVIISGDTAEIEGVSDACVVWQDADIISSVGVQRGYVVFETASTWRKGNAVLAVKNSEGTILWSWHIWSTDYVLGSNDIQVYNHAKTNLYKMMARSLGEVNGRATYYQFGRKDPFPAKKAEKIGTSGSLNASIQQPDTFFANSGSDWCTASRTDWWDAGCNSNNSSSSSASTLKGGKTIYDPCPAGYRVPPDDAFTNFTTTGTNTESASEINSPSTSAFYMNDYSFSFYTGVGSNTITFKALGGLNAKTGSVLNYIAYYYGAHPSGYSTSRLLQFYSNAVKPQNTDYSRALAGTIRPVRNEVESETIYESQDYSKDGTMIQLKSHTVGTGIKILIVGDGFTDKDIDSGKYDMQMKLASEYFFNIEPFKSFQDRFDVVNMRVVSQTSVFDAEKRTAFQAAYEGGSHITGNLSAAYQRAIKAFGTYKDVVIIVVMNSTRYAGTCYMAGKTVSVAFCPTSTETYYPYETVVHHEAGGHGFANLGDEYGYGGTIPDSEKQEISTMFASYGWYPNLDCNSDRETIRWSQFLSDDLYSTSTGVYQGGYGYSYGVYRPTSDSCMNHMYGEFNAPSRFAIYKRIMERSGDTWSWEKFIAYDVINRSTRSAGAYYPVPNYYIPHQSPIAVDLKDYGLE